MHLSLNYAKNLKRIVVFLLVDEHFDQKYLINAEMLVFFFKMRVEKYNKTKEQEKNILNFPTFEPAHSLNFQETLYNCPKIPKNIIKSQHWNHSFEWDPYTEQMEDIWSLKLKIFRDLREATKKAQKDYLIVPYRGITKYSKNSQTSHL